MTIGCAGPSSDQVSLSPLCSDSSKNVIRNHKNSDSTVTSHNKSSKTRKKHRTRPEDKLQLSQYGNRDMKKNESNITATSIPLATQIYKASSDDFKHRKKGNKKSKKSVLTLPNEPAVFPKVYTVSDINESDYKRVDGVRWKQKYRTASSRLKKRPSVKQNIKVYDEVSQYYSKLKIDLDYSASNVNKALKGNSKKKHTTDMKGECQAHDVWALLRNINRFHFRPSPTMSESSLEQMKKNRSSIKRRNNRKDTRVIETCRTEEIKFSFDLQDGSSHTLSQSTSYDRITVIDKRNEQKMLGDTLNRIDSPRQSRHKKLAIKNFPNARPNHFSTTNNPAPRSMERSKRYQGNTMSLQRAKSQVTHANSITNNNKNLSHYPIGTDGYNGRNSLQKLDDTDDDFPDKSPKTSAESSIHVIKGITKVVVKENEKVLQDDNELPKRRSRLFTSTPSSGSATKLTQAITKKRLASLKFPITILSKDQINPVKVPTNQFSQFAGLDQQIWPFMKDWFIRDPLKKKEQKKSVDTTVQKCDNLLSKIRKNRDVQSILKKNSEYSTNLNKTEAQIEHVKKLNGLHQLKDKVLKLLYKKAHQISSSPDLAGDSDIPSPEVLNHLIKKHYGTGLVDVGTNPKIVYNSSPKSSKRLSGRTAPSMARVSLPETKLPPVLTKPLVDRKAVRSKPNWANEFIESVIRKIKNGIYYNQESPSPSIGSVSPSLDKVNESLVTCAEKDKVDNETENVEPEKPEELVKTSSSILITEIPGFDEPLPALEILTLTDNRIAIKQCLTNITMQFDIVLPAKVSSSLQNTRVLAPSILNGDDPANTTKCNTSILNAILPAELCSIVPKMLNELSVNSAKVAISSVEINKSHSKLSTISEQSRCDSLIAQPNMVISVGMKLVFGGRYSHHMPVVGLNNHSIPNICYMNDIKLIGKILPQAKVRHLILLEKACLPRLMHLRREKYPQPTCIIKTEDVCSPDLHLETLDNLMLKETDKFNLCDILSKIAKSHNFMITVNLQNFANSYTYEFSKVTDVTQKQLVIQLTMNLNDYLSSESNIYRYRNALPPSENNVLIQKPLKTAIPAKLRKRNYLKLYKKCKSTSNIPVKKSSTPLDEINNMEQFCQILGSDNKAISSVFDSIIEKKVLACLTQMKSWVTEITSVQAMLVLLLLNRKDSPNLIRLRPILLQAISVNRITRANELDMEVEVIENEQFQMPFEYAPIPYKPAAVRVVDADDEKLLEELRWVAKTTASDYQRIYDDTSEKLLKALLNKRKKLNPSYLRVMARYVGLGLLKSPMKL